MQWVVPHIVSHSQTLAYNGGSGLPPSGSGAVNHFLSLEALQMHFLYVNSTSNALHVLYNNPPVRITFREATEQKINILLEWPNVYL